MNVCTSYLRPVVLAAACLGLVAGCKGKGEKVDPGPGGKTTGQEIVESMRRGIEVHRLLDRPYRHRLEAVLSHYSAEPLGLSEQQLELWRNEGLRLVAVPADEKEIEKLIVALTGESVVERVRMGVVPEWRAVATAPKIDGSKLVRVGGEIGPFVGGRFRLLLRAYPLLGAASPVLRTQLIVQFHQPKRDPFAPDAAKEERMGVYVPTSALSMDLDGTWAVLVTAEDPGKTWGESAPEPAKDDKAEEAKTQTETDAAGAQAGAGDAKKDAGAAPPGGPGQGPESPRIRTSGEEALISPDGNTRFVLIFLPRVK